MSRALIHPENPRWRNALGFIAALVIIPIAIIAVLIWFPFARPAKRSPEEVADYLRDFIEGTGDDWDWDDFTSVEIADPILEDIRHRAKLVELPASAEGLETLKQLLAETELQSDQAQKNSVWPRP